MPFNWCPISELLHRVPSKSYQAHNQIIEMRQEFCKSIVMMSFFFKENRDLNPSPSLVTIKLTK